MMFAENVGEEKAVEKTVEVKVVGAGADLPYAHALGHAYCEVPGD